MGTPQESEALLRGLSRFGILLDEWEEDQVDLRKTSEKFQLDYEDNLSILAQMAYLVTNITFASTRSDVMEITSLAQRELMIIVAIVGVGVTVVVIAAGVVVESSSIVKLSFVVT
ncbi:hypothetical protein Tco_0294571 [Tanacetum coccineum]